MPEQVAACREAGMDGHMNKPVDRRELLATLAERSRQAA
jgi:CheY-like chemotaxis protein